MGSVDARSALEDAFSVGRRRVDVVPAVGSPATAWRDGGAVGSDPC